MMAAIVNSEMTLVWNAWYAQHSSDVDFDPSELFVLKAESVKRALAAAQPVVAALDL